MGTFTEIDSITPIEEHHGIFFKRDDYYSPYPELPEFGGGKTRQMQLLFEEMKTKHGLIKGLITCPVSLTSPQSAIVAKIAKDNNIPCMICFGGKVSSIEKTINNYKPLKLSFQLGAEIKVVAAIGYSNVVGSKVVKISKNNNYQIVDFGINLSDYHEAIIGSTANQVENLPDNLDNLIIPCGSAITMAGIIVGVEKFKKNVKRIIGIQICNKNRIKEIDKILNIFGIKRKYEFHLDKTYSYSKNITQYIDSEFELNVKYESKAFRYFLRNKTEFGISDTDKTLFWCVANNNFLFD